MADNLTNRKKKTKASFRSLEEIVASASDILRPPERLTVPESAERYRELRNEGGGYVGPYKNDNAPYMVEPGEILTSYEYQAMIFVGPAQSGKTETFPSWIVHSALCDPADMMLISPTHDASRDFSKRRLVKLHMDTKALKKQLLPGKQSANVFDVRYKSGMLLTLSHPSVAELRGKPIPRLWLTDFDAMPASVDGEGNPFDLARMRARTFKRFGMVVAESSPGRDVRNVKWVRTTSHEAPPTDSDSKASILSLYNRGDRRRFFWFCPHCSEPFEPTFDMLTWPEEGDDVFRAESATMVCPHCHDHIDHHQKHALNIKGRWVRDGQKLRADGTLTGLPMRSDIASFWLQGVCASFATWKDLVMKYIKAEEEYDKTGSEEALRATVNADQGQPYIPKAAATARLPEDLKNRAEDWGGTATDPCVPDGVRFLMATVDVQAGLKPAFVVHVYGVGVGNDIWHIHMFKIRKSKRIGDDGNPLNIDPAAYAEDWDVLIDDVMTRTYPLNDGSGRRMQVKLTGCDSGGKEGVTFNAYNFWRKLKNMKDGLQNRFQLLKGTPTPAWPHYKISFPDSTRKDRKAGARGDVPVGMMNSNLMKDQVSSLLGRTDIGGGMIHFPAWSEDWLYMQLTAEIRNDKGQWEKVGSKRNEAFDLLYYCLAMLRDPRINAHRIDWEKPPSWAEVWDENDLILEAEDDAGLVIRAPKKRRSFSDIGKGLG